MTKKKLNCYISSPAYSGTKMLNLNYDEKRAKMLQTKSRYKRDEGGNEALASLTLTFKGFKLIFQGF